MRREERLGEKGEWEEAKQGKSMAIQAEETKLMAMRFLMK